MQHHGKESHLANHKSEIKRAKQNEIRNFRNRSNKSRIKTAVKAVRLTVAETALDRIEADLNAAKSIIDRAAQKGIIHRRTAARKISRLTRLVNSTQKS
ncbi:30S ribosomal protein S20 [Desulfatirhabdium butyrativorans]|uniref:30S ribosomal protein S20 n=1 Tax=Desulfatirhabdium butyrativorans TaxID=340467 RepID=UPI001FE1C966|nr:30S ribosomal protein S20 [Desulfatirhabdium butyrativorans]